MFGLVVLIASTWIDQPLMAGADLVLEGDVVRYTGIYDRNRKGSVATLAPTRVYRGSAGGTVEVCLPIGCSLDGDSCMGIDGIPWPEQGSHVLAILAWNSRNDCYNLSGQSSWLVRRVEYPGHDVMVTPEEGAVSVPDCDRLETWGGSMSWDAAAHAIGRCAAAAAFPFTNVADPVFTF